MPYSVKWYIDKRVMLSRYEGVITLEDARGQVAEGNALLGEGIPLVHSIIDMTGVTNNPSLKMVNEFRSVDLGDLRKKLGWTVVITNNTLLKFASASFSSLDEALAFMRDEDPTLPR